MRRPHIALFIHPHFPHVHPTIPIVSTLVRRGYRTTFVTSRVFEPKLSQLGAEVVPRPQFSFETTEPAGEPAYCRHARATLRNVESFYDKNRPDLIIYDLVDLAGRILATRWKIPAAHITPHFAFDRDTLPQQIRSKTVRELALEESSNADRFLNEHGVPSEGFLFHRERLNIYPFPRVLQPHGVRHDSRLLYAGRCPGEQPSFGAWNMDEADGRPIILVAASTTYARDADYFPTCIEALQGLGAHVVFSVGAKANKGLIPPLPEHFQVVQDVSHGRILPHAELLVYQGGTTTTAEAAYHGVPVLAVTCGKPELEWLADNIVEVGIGLRLNKSEMNAQNLRNRAERLLGDSSLRSRMKEVQYTVRREPGAEEVVNAMEELL